jgi:hypothetical protein
VYLRGHEGRGIGLGEKLRAYELQDRGLDTAEANVALGHPVDARDYCVAAQILRDLSVDSVVLLSNNPAKAEALTEYGIDVCRFEPLLTTPTADNVRYLRTKLEKLGHQLQDDLQPYPDCRPTDAFLRDQASSRPSLPRTITNTVVEGDARGRLLGFRTANMHLPEGEEAPRFGVYAGRALGRPAAVSVGVRPTYGDDLKPLVETHILDFDGDLYGEVMSVELLEFLRPEARFTSEEALREQIREDVTVVRSRFSSRAHLAPPVDELERVAVD